MTDKSPIHVDLSRRIERRQVTTFMAWLGHFLRSNDGEFRNIDCAKVIGSMFMLPSTNTFNIKAAVSYLRASDGNDLYAIKLIIPFLALGEEFGDEGKQAVINGIYSLHLAIKSVVVVEAPESSELLTYFFLNLAKKLGIDPAEAGLGTIREA